MWTEYRRTLEPMGGKESLLRLYGRILRLHRAKLPLPLRDMGDQYVREEFRQMWNLKDADLKRHYPEFTSQWQNYARTLSLSEEGGRPAGEGAAEDALGSLGSSTSGDLSEESLEGLSDEQREQLKRLKDEIDGLMK